MDLAPARDEGRRMGLSVEEAGEAIAFREKMLKERMRANGVAERTDEKDGGKTGKKVNGAREGTSAVHSEDEADDEADERTPFLTTAKRRASKPGNGRLDSGEEEEEDDIQPKIKINPLAPSTEVYDKVKTALEERQQAKSVSASRNRSRGAGADEAEGDEPDLEGGMGTGDTAGRVRAGRDDERILVNDVMAPKGKRVAVPVRIEPKVYFATERTFLVRPLSFPPSLYTAPD